MEQTKSKNKKQLDIFIEYCQKHPEQRFWQALRNVCGYSHIFICNGTIDNPKTNCIDTFFIE